MTGALEEPFFAVINGAAGGGRCRSRFDRLRGRLEQSGMRLEAHLTSAPGHATELVGEAYASGRRRFLVVGGDGTSYEAVNGLFAHGGRPEGVVVGMLPLGTGNSFLRDFGVTHEEAAIDALLRGRRRKVDVVRCEHEDGVLHYLNLLSIGFTARAGALTNAQFKPLGAAGYVAAVLLSVARLEYPTDPVRLDEGEVDRRPAAFLSFSNSKYTGGAMMMAPKADPTDGRVDVIRVGTLPRLPFVATFPKIFSGTHVDRPEVEEAQVRRVEFLEPREQDVMVDGEIVRLAIRSLEVVPEAIEVMV
jgi:YegS/Rv2252/BmrU family lipid kinase